jgi:hypothetical protein
MRRVTPEISEKSWLIESTHEIKTNEMNIEVHDVS